MDQIAIAHIEAPTILRFADAPTTTRRLDPLARNADDYASDATH
jgi:hypothetical protein